MARYSKARKTSTKSRSYGASRRSSGRRTTRRNSRRGYQSRNPSTVRIVVEQVAANPLSASPQMQGEVVSRKAMF